MLPYVVIRMMSCASASHELNRGVEFESVSRICGFQTYWFFYSIPSKRITAARKDENIHIQSFCWFVSMGVPRIRRSAPTLPDSYWILYLWGHRVCGNGCSMDASMGTGGSSVDPSSPGVPRVKATRTWSGGYLGVPEVLPEWLRGLSPPMLGSG